jgi:hypothetical protein
MPSSGSPAAPLFAGVTPDQVQMYIKEAVASAVAPIAAASASGAPAMPARHTQLLQEYMDAAISREVSSLRQDIRDWMVMQSDESMKQFQLAQEDVIDLHSSLKRQFDALSMRVEQLHQKLDRDEATRTNLGHWA